MRQEVVFLQVSHKLTSPENPVLRYYEKVYSKHEGFVIPEHFMEVPTWIAEVGGRLDDHHYTKSVHIVESYIKTSGFLWRLWYNNPEAILMMSVMDVNKEIMWKIAKETGHRVIIGGYIEDKSFYHHLLNCEWLDSVDDLSKVLPHIKAGVLPDYWMFQDMECIPRLKMSTGCLHNCSFCTIEREVKSLGYKQVMAQAQSFEPLEFKLVYVDDKTFGQADNWEWLDEVGDVLYERDHDFEGFIVQTTVNQALMHYGEWYDMGVRYIEVGVEIPNDEYLAKMNKPYRMIQLRQLTNHLRAFGKMGFIPNLIFGAPNEPYKKLYEWVAGNQDIISFVNPYILCQYHDSKGEFVSAADKMDAVETSFERSWLSPSDQQEMMRCLKDVMMITDGRLIRSKK